jgi:hypothetical protein
MNNDVPLSSTDLKNIFDGELKVMIYKELKKCKTIDEVLHPYNRVCILYNWTPSVGHWTCLFKKDNTIYFFDSFGSIPDGKTNYGQIPKNIRNHMGLEYKYLTKLLYESPYEIDYNPMPIQDIKSSTCGRYCALRLALYDMTTEDFNKLFSKNKKLNDELIMNLTDEE